MTRMRATGLLAVALLLGGGAFDSPSLYVPAVGLAVLAASTAAWVRLAKRGAAVERLPGAWSVAEGEPYRLAVRVSAGRIPAPGGRLIDPLGEAPLTLGPRFGGEVVTEARFEGRGRRRLPAVRLEIADPLGLQAVSLHARAGAEVLVLPRVEPVVVPVHGGRLSRRGGEGGGQGTEAGLDAEAVDFEIDGLRPYRIGTPASRIHWRSVARSVEMIEHRLVSAGGSAPIVVLDAHQPADFESLDRAVRAAGSLCVYLASRGGCALLLPGELRARRLDRTLRAWPDLHARLALVEKCRRPPTLQQGRSGSVYWVSAAIDAGAVAARAGLSDGYLVTPGEPHGSDAFAVAGCRGRALTASLQRPIARVA